MINCGFVARFEAPISSHAVSLMARVNGLRVPLITSIPLASLAPRKSRSKFGSYTEWVLGNEPDMFWPANEVASRLKSLRNKPLISIILPTFNTPRYFLIRCLESVRQQHYSNWQLCICDDNSSDKDVVEMIGAAANADRRIRFQASESQGGISRASNKALELATGEYVVLLDHDDELHPSALVEVVRAINLGSFDLIYSDEDKIDKIGIRSQPAFKPAFDRDLFFSFNYLGHLVALKRNLVSKIDGFRPHCDGAQDWDLVIRAVETTDPHSIYHIPKPLYHWRMHDNSTSTNLDAKPYVARSWRCVLQEHVERTTPDPAVTPGLFYGSMRLRYPSPHNMKLGVFVRASDGAAQAGVIRLNAGKRPVQLYTVIHSSVVKIGSSAGNRIRDTVAEYSPIPSLTELDDDIFVFFNAQLESLNHLFFDEVVSQCMRDDCGVVAGLAIDGNNKVISAGFLTAEGNTRWRDPFAGAEVTAHGYMGLLWVIRTIDACSDLFFAVRRKHLADVGGLGVVDASGFAYLRDLLCDHAAQKGLNVLYTPYAVATFSQTRQTIEPSLSALETGAATKLNRHLLTFEYAADVLQGRREV